MSILIEQIYVQLVDITLGNSETCSLDMQGIGPMDEQDVVAEIEHEVGTNKVGLDVVMGKFELAVKEFILIELVASL